MTIKFESLSSLLADGLEDLLQEDYDTVEYTPFPLDVDWQSAFMFERLGTFKAIAVRWEGHLVGYNAFHITPHFHSKSVPTAFNDVIYLAPAYRGWTGLALMWKSEALLAGAGAKQLFYSVKTHDPRLERFGKLLLHLGYEHTEQVWRKIL